MPLKCVHLDIILKEVSQKESDRYKIISSVRFKDALKGSNRDTSPTCFTIALAPLFAFLTVIEIKFSLFLFYPAENHDK